ncbi:NmrA family NAD(P)-binding protein [Kutzneria sp. NPDC052558]|uniref:NmrA family NAD(P)-binding protein n=1 Tax=Kutzneria sp. NPDC052558 TaxID=3364121 RepID=UPI0037C7124F
MALHRPVEDALASSGLRWTMVRPNFYLQNFLRQASIRESGRFSFPLITAPISFVDVGDIADVAARVLTTEGHDSKIYSLTGPKALSHTEAAEVFSDVLGKPVRYLGLPDEQARAALLSRGMPAFQVDTLIEVARAYRDGGAEMVTSAVPDPTGHAALGFADFVRRHRNVLG